jgi:hypothetical protein
VRFQTVTESPRLSMPSTIALPSSPVPINATSAMSSLPLQSIPVRRVHTCDSSPSLVGYAGLRSADRPAWRFPAVADVRAVESRQAPQVLRWAGDPEGGAPFVEADPPDPISSSDSTSRSRDCSPLASAGRPSSSTSASIDRPERSPAATPTSA